MVSYLCDFYRVPPLDRLRSFAPSVLAITLWEVLSSVFFEGKQEFSPLGFILFPKVRVKPGRVIVATSPITSALISKSSLSQARKRSCLVTLFRSLIPTGSPGLFSLSSPACTSIVRNNCTPPISRPQEDPYLPNLLREPRKITYPFHLDYLFCLFPLPFQ